VAFVVLLTLGVRVGALSEGYWIDEAISADTAALPLGELLARCGLADVHPPGYYLMLKLWTAVAGSSDLSGRLLSVVISLATVLLLVRYASRLYGAQAGLISGLILALSPVHAHYSVEVRSYTLLTGLTLLGLWSLERLMARPQRRARQLALVAVLSALCWTHNLGLVIAALLLAPSLVRASGEARQVVRAVAWLVAGLFTPWLPVLLVQVRHQPEAMTAHLAAPFGPLDLLAGLGPAPLVGSSLLGACAGLLALGGALWGLSASAPRRAPTEESASETSSTRPLHGAALLLAIFGPLVALGTLPLSTLTFDLVAGEVPAAYALVVIAASVVALLARRGEELASRLPGSGLLLLVSLLATLVILDFFRPLLNVRNTLPLLPFIALGLGAATAARAHLAFVIALLWIGLSASSIATLSDRVEDGLIPARDDLRGAAHLVDDESSMVAVIPPWDVPALSRYLAADRRVIGALDPAQLDLAGARRLQVVLTRSAAEDPDPFLEAIERSLGPDLIRQGQWRLRGAPSVEVVRYGPPDEQERAESQ